MMMKVVITTGAVARTKLQSNCQLQHTITKTFLQALPDAQPAVSEHWRQIQIEQKPKLVVVVVVVVVVYLPYEALND